MMMMVVWIRSIMIMRIEIHLERQSVREDVERPTINQARVTLCFYLINIFVNNIILWQESPLVKNVT